MAEALQKIREEQIWNAAGDLPGIAIRKFGSAVMRGARWIGSKIRAGWNWIGGKLGFKKPVAAKIPPPPEPEGWGMWAAKKLAQGAVLVGKGAGKAAAAYGRLMYEYPRTGAALTAAGLLGAAYYAPLTTYGATKYVAGKTGETIAKRAAEAAGLSPDNVELAGKVGNLIGTGTVAVPVETARFAYNVGGAAVDAGVTGVQLAANVTEPIRDPYKASRDFQEEYMRSGPAHVSKWGLVKATLANVITFGHAMPASRAMEMASERLPMDTAGYTEL